MTMTIFNRKNVTLNGRSNFIAVKPSFSQCGLLSDFILDIFLCTSILQYKGLVI